MIAVDVPVPSSIPRTKLICIATGLSTSNVSPSLDFKSSLIGAVDDSAMIARQRCTTDFLNRRGTLRTGQPQEESDGRATSPWLRSKHKASLTDRPMVLEFHT